MTVVELLTQISRLFFLSLSAITFLNYLLHRDKIRRDIFLVFLSLSFSQWLTLLTTTLGVDAPWRPLLGQLAITAQPFLILRIVRYFREVPQRVYVVAIAGVVLSWVALIVTAVTGTTVASSPVVTLVIVAYFVVIDGYSALAFIYGAFQSVGVVRQQLQLAAAGSAFLGLVLLLAGINVVAPGARPFTLPLIQLGSVLSSIAFFLGFVPPRWLRQAWRDAELRKYIQDVQMVNLGTRADILKQLYTAISRGMGTNVVRVKVALWDKEAQDLVLQDSGELPSLLDDPHLENLTQKAWDAEDSYVVDKSRGLNDEDKRLMKKVGAETILIVPIAVYHEVLGQLVVFLQHGSLFIDEDLNLLTLFAQHIASQLQRHAMLDELYRRNEDLEHKVADRTADLQRSNEELKMFAYVASHDLQEPLRTISSYLQLIDQRYTEKLDAEGREFIAFAVDGAQRMKELIEDVLVYSRVETERKNFVAFNSQQLVDDVIKSLETSVSESGAIVTTDALPQVMADKRLFTQLFQNLLSNAIKYRGTVRKPEIHVGVAQQNGNWLFSVKDNGIGIEPQYLEQIFVVFRRLHHREEYKGTGIGLAVCKKAVELHGGRIWAESTAGIGSTFFFTIPR